MQKENITYKSAGVDTHAGQKFVSKIKPIVQGSFSPNVLGGLGGFAAAYDVSFLKEYKEPILLSGTDGVGTKLEIARQLNKHNTVGIDLVAMCVNDLLVNGAKPLFFLDYIACGKLHIEKMTEIVTGITEGCKQCGASLIGGETAEHPGLMEEDEYDLAGFAVGVVEKSEIIDGKSIKKDDAIIGIESSGPHSNGFSLLRKLYLKDGKLPSNSLMLDFIQNHLMKPTKIYVKSILELIKKVEVKGMVHITGGGFYENIPRILKNDLGAKIFKKQLPESYVFDRVMKDFSIDETEMFSTFNMGVGFMLVVPFEKKDDTLSELARLGEKAKFIGTIVETTNSNKVEIVD